VSIGTTSSQGSNPPRIVVGIDGSLDSTRALDWATRQAALTGAVLELVTAYRPGYTYASAEDIQAAMDSVLDDARNHVATLSPELTLKSATHEAIPAKVLIDASREADLLVVGCRGLGGFSGLLLGSVGKECAHQAQCPLVIVRPAKDELQSPRPHRIAVGVDGSPQSARALEWAAAQAERTDATVLVVLAWQWPVVAAWGIAYSDDYHPEQDARIVLDRMLDTLHGDHPSVKVESELRHGHASSVLVEASHVAELLVVGSRGRGEFVGMVLGSVSEHCVSNADCPVVVVRQPE
jgi:nucleotide-binding universal stress UspA family protein